MPSPHPDEPPAKRIRTEVQQTLYLKNLNDKVNKNVLQHILYVLFSTYGDVLCVMMPPRLRGQAHIVLDTKQLANNAVRGLQGLLLFGKPVIIDYAKTKTHFVENYEKE